MIMYLPLLCVVCSDTASGTAHAVGSDIICPLLLVGVYGHTSLTEWRIRCGQLLCIICPADNSLCEQTSSIVHIVYKCDKWI